MKKLELIGQRFGRLKVVGLSHSTIQGLFWKCLCDCGNEKVILGKRLRRTTRSCGCLSVDTIRKMATTHGQGQTREHAIWCGIKNRCYNSKTKSYRLYGARGVIMSDAWRNSFETFIEDMGVSPHPNSSIERINNNGPYSKGNCKWATAKEQCGNRRSNKWLTYKNISKIQIEWAVELGIDSSHIRFHLKQGRPFEWIYDYFKNKK